MRSKLWCVGIGILALAAVACSGGSDPETPVPTSESTGPLILTQTAKDMAITTIKGFPAVLDATVSQDAGDLSLEVVVECGTSETYAKNMGDNFARMIKTFGPEAAPTAPTGSEIGTGDFNYLVRVFLVPIPISLWEQRTETALTLIGNGAGGPIASRPR